MVHNKIGLEAEFLVKDSEGNICFPQEYGFDFDDYIILGEIRGKPGETSEETITNFLKEWYKVLNIAKKNNLTLDISGSAKIEPEFKRKILQEMGRKYFSATKNIYETEILELTDDVVENGKVIYSYLSTGLHIHFSSEEYLEIKNPAPEYCYRQINIPINNGENYPKMEMEVFLREEIKNVHEFTNILSINRITKPVINYFVKKLDEIMLPQYNYDLSHLKYRSPGFYETKHYGFEYRSFPFTQKVLDDLLIITNYCFELLEDLDID